MKDIDKKMEQENNVSANQPKKHVHLGTNIQRIREILNIKQIVLADMMNISQQAISKLENREYIEDKTLDKVAKVLKVPVLLIKNFDQEHIAHDIVNNYYDDSKNFNDDSADHTQITNTIEMVKLALQENKKLYERIIKEKEQEIKTLKEENENLRKIH